MATAWIAFLRDWRCREACHSEAFTTAGNRQPVDRRIMSLAIAFENSHRETIAGSLLPQPDRPPVCDSGAHGRLRIEAGALLGSSAARPTGESATRTTP